MTSIIKKSVRQLLSFCFEAFKTMYLFFINKGKTNQTAFPNKDDFRSYLNEPLVFPNCKKKYFTQYYQINDLENFSYKYSMVEILPARKTTSINVSEKSLIPVSFQSEGTLIIKSENGEEKILSGFRRKRYYYVKLNSNEKLVVNESKDVILGDPIEIEKKSKVNIKLVLCIFVDGLSNFFPKKTNLKTLMPNTYNFFSEGVIFNNCHANGEWSLPSVASFFTGQYTHLHKIFHPRKKLEIGIDKKILSEYFKQNDYLTFQIGSNWRKSPSYGYVKGFDRTIYKRDATCDEIITNLLEQLFAFDDREQFGWIDLFDLHRGNYANNCPPLSCQSHYNNELHSYKELDKKNKSVFKKFDTRKVERYYQSITRLDKYMKIIYDYIENNYTNDDILIMLCSDHGQAYLDFDNHPLSDNRIKVPFMIRGKKIPKNIQSDELIENVDIFPTMLKMSNIKFDKKNISGKLPNILGGKEPKKSVFSESIFPGQTYKAVIRDKKYKYYFETEHPVTDEGAVKLGVYKTKLIDKKNGLEVTDEDKLIKQYTKYVLQGIDDLLISKH
jgi:arylsulfatase A-like enzyme